MSRIFLLRRFACAALLIVPACSQGHVAASPVGATPPRMTSTLHPQLAPLDNLSAAALRDAVMQVEIAVMVDADGRPDMSTLKLAGNATSNNRTAITEWIANSTYEPGRRDGVPVRSEFRSTLKTKVEVRRR